MSKLLLIIVLSIILGGIILIIPSIIKGYLDLKKPLKMLSNSIHDMESLNDYLKDDRQTLCNQISLVKLTWNDCVEELTETNYELDKVFKSMKNGVSVDKVDEISSNYEYLLLQKKALESLCRQYKYDYRHLNHLLSVIDTVL